jgi:competence protein ComEA
MTRLRIARGVFLTVVGAIVLFVIYSILKRPEASIPVLTTTPRPLPTLLPVTPSPSLVSVYVIGAVNKPDVYSLPLGANVKDAITVAGGATTDADLDRINLALRLTDQLQVRVPRKGEVVPPPSDGAAAPGSTGALININTATLEQLDTLPGIGLSYAQAIIDYRTQNGAFKTIEEIKNVKHIGDSVFAKIKDQITVGP